VRRVDCKVRQPLRVTVTIDSCVTRRVFLARPQLDSLGAFASSIACPPLYLIVRPPPPPPPSLCKTGLVQHWRISYSSDPIFLLTTTHHLRHLRHQSINAGLRRPLSLSQHSGTSALYPTSPCTTKPGTYSSTFNSPQHLEPPQKHAREHQYPSNAHARHDEPTLALRGPRASAQ
jgi:hypothetical protein